MESTDVSAATNAIDDLGGTLESLREELSKPEPNARRVRHFRQTAKFEQQELDDALRGLVGRGTGAGTTAPPLAPTGKVAS